jgi:hypothetical protein
LSELSFEEALNYTNSASYPGKYECESWSYEGSGIVSEVGLLVDYFHPVCGNTILPQTDISVNYTMLCVKLESARSFEESLHFLVLSSFKCRFFK